MRDCMVVDLEKYARQSFKILEKKVNESSRIGEDSKWSFLKARFQSKASLYRRVLVRTLKLLEKNFQVPSPGRQCDRSEFRRNRGSRVAVES